MQTTIYDRISMIAHTQEVLRKVEQGDIQKIKSAIMYAVDYMKNKNLDIEDPIDEAVITKEIKDFLNKYNP